jgi:NADP-dependent 3-hydroxy acid dehydrogenase YdfG
MSGDTKVVVITGASSGIGQATARLLAGRGYKVMLGARRSEVLSALTEELRQAGGQAAYKVTDVTRRSDLEALVGHAVDHFGQVDAIVNNAGIGPISRLDTLRVDDWDAMIDVNLRGTLYGIAAVLPIFARQQRGHVINIISTAGIKILPTMGVYAATKNAVRTVTEALRQEAGPHLRVTEVSPGMVATSFGDSITDIATKEEIQKRMGDIAIPPEAIARGVLFALEQPPEVEVGSLVIRPTAQG